MKLPLEEFTQLLAKLSLFIVHITQWRIQKLSVGCEQKLSVKTGASDLSPALYNLATFLLIFCFSVSSPCTLQPLSVRPDFSAKAGSTLTKKMSRRLMGDASRRPCMDPPLTVQTSISSTFSFFLFYLRLYSGFITQAFKSELMIARSHDGYMEQNHLCVLTVCVGYRLRSAQPTLM